MPFRPSLPVAGLAASVLLAAAAFASAFGDGGAGRGPAVLLALATALRMASLVALGGVRGGRVPGVVRWAAGVVLVGVGGGLGVALLLGGGEGADSALVGGLPPAAAVLVYGVGLLPALVVPLLYAWAFDRTTLSRDDVERVRRAARGEGAE